MLKGERGLSERIVVGVIDKGMCEGKESVEQLMRRLGVVWKWGQEYSTVQLIARPVQGESHCP